MMITFPETGSRTNGALAGSQDVRAGVLLVDDDPNTLFALEQALSTLEIDAVTAASGEEALRQLLRRDFALILLDVRLPGLDGYEVATLVRQRERNRHVPIIFLSGVNKDEVHMVRGYSAGAVDYVLKPVDPAVLRSKVAVFVDLFNKARELQRLLDENIRANAERRMAEQQQAQVQKIDALGQLTGGIAHDFNNMLSVVIGNLERVQRQVAADDPKLALRLDMAMQGALRCSDLTRRLLTFARRQPLQAAPLNVNGMVGGMMPMLRRTLADEIRITLDLSADPGAVVADRAQAESALLNLVVNARDAMPGGGTIRIETANVTLGEEDDRFPQTPPGDYVLLGVVDSGTGMPADVRERAFEPFFTTKELGHGTGLGLSIIHGFVRQSGGDIRIDSEPGGGTAVRFVLPRAVAAAEATE